jgi:hypothetical protein
MTVGSTDRLTWRQTWANHVLPRGTPSLAVGFGLLKIGLDRSGVEPVTSDG